MRIVGAATLRAPAAEVWAALRDPAVVARAIPGCDGFEVTAPRQARFTTTTTMNPVAGAYSGTLSIADQQPPSVIVATASAAGDRGGVKADITLRLTPDDNAGTLVSYEASGDVDGAIAAVGTRLLASAAKRVAEEFLASVDAELADRRVSPKAYAAAGAANGQGATPETRAAAPAATPGPALARRISDAVMLAGRKEIRIAFAAGAAAGLAAVIVRILIGGRSRRSAAGTHRE